MSQEELGKIAAPFQAQIDSLKQQLASRPAAPIPAAPKPNPPLTAESLSLRQRALSQLSQLQELLDTDFEEIWKEAKFLPNDGSTLPTAELLDRAKKFDEQLKVVQSKQSRQNSLAFCPDITGLTMYSR